MTVAYSLNNEASLSLFCDTNALQVKNYKSNICNNHNKAAQMMIGNSGSSIRYLMMTMEIMKSILIFRDAFHLPCSNKPINELVLETIEDLHHHYPYLVPKPSISKMAKTSIGQGLVHLYISLKCMRVSWLKHNNLMPEDNQESLDDMNMEQLGERVKELLDQATKVAREVIQTVPKDDSNPEQVINNQPKPMPMDIDNMSKTRDNISDVMLDERLQVVLFRSPQSSSISLSREVTMPSVVPELVSQTLVTRPSPPPPPPVFEQVVNCKVGSPPVIPPVKGAPPPPPPLGAKSVLSALKATTKLKRSAKLGNLYRQLKRKLDGSSNVNRRSQGKNFKVGASNGNKGGMSGAIEEMMKRSSYYQQIQKDVQNHGNKINEIKSSLLSFQNKDMQELIEFHKYVESSFEQLTDESQVLARFEGFPTTKLEAIRSASALYTKLDGILTTLKTWKIEGPLSQLLDKVEAYFTKIKLELDGLERLKDEDSKRFQSENIHFDFQIIQKIKESMVDVSSGCIELALKEKRRTKTVNKGERSVKLLWRAFQLAFRVYMFAGGQDDQAERLTTELAQEIEANAQE